MGFSEVKENALEPYTFERALSNEQLFLGALIEKSL